MPTDTGLPFDFQRSPDSTDVFFISIKEGQFRALQLMGSISENQSLAMVSFMLEPVMFDHLLQCTERFLIQDNGAVFQFM